MYNGKYNTHNRKRRLRWNKQFVLLVSILALVLGVAGGSLAYLFTHTDPVQNTFTAAIPDVTIPETFNGAEKKDVSVKNTGDLDAYVRARIVATWQDGEGNVSSTMPVAGTDYTLTLNINNGSLWEKSGDYYYWKDVVKSGEKTDVLIKYCAPIAGSAPDGYYLVVDVLAETIQAEPKTAVKEVWGFVPGQPSN